MLETPHVVVGAAIAAKIGNPALSIPLALASHFVLDRVPHWNPHFFTETKKFGKPKKESINFAVVDELLAIGIAILVSGYFLPDYGRSLTILAASGASVLPDQVKLPYFFFKARNKFLEAWVKFERSLQVETSFIPGMLVQFVVVVAGLYWIFTK